MSTLDQWEAETKEWQKKLEAPGIYAPNCERILALIDLVRKKDKALKKYENMSSSLSSLEYSAKAALALTEELK